MRKKFHATIVWFITTLYVIYAFSLNTAGAVFSDAIKSSLKVSHLGAAFAVGGFIAGFALMQLPAGFLLDKYKARYVVSCGIFLLALGNLLISFADNIYLFTMANLLQGIGAAFSFLAASVLTAQWFTPRMFPIMLGLTQLFASIFAAILHHIFHQSLTTNSIQTIYLYLSICGLIMLILSIVLVQNPTTTKTKHTILFLNSIKTVIGNKQLWLCIIANATSFGTLLAFIGFWHTAVQKHYLLTNTNLYIGGIILVGLGIGTPIWGWLSNLMRSRKKIIFLTLSSGCIILIVTLYAPLFAIKQEKLLLVFSFLVGFLLSGSMLFYTIVKESFSDANRGLAISMINMAAFLFNTLLLFLPQLFVMSYLYDVSLWILPVAILIAIIALVPINETYK